MKTLKEIIENGLCLGCGTCAGVCPNQAIVMLASECVFTPKIDEMKCNGCQLCVKCCPGESVDFEELQQTVFGQKVADNFLGPVSACYIGSSTDDHLRFDSASGGLITQVLTYALENKLIDGAVVTRMRKDNPIEPEAFIARTKEEIIEAARSKYCPVATNVCLKQILKEEGRFAVVGLPCHLQGVRKAEAISPILKKRIVMHLGLLCSHTVDFAGIYFLLDKVRVKRDEVSKMTYRGSGWPGSMFIERKNGSKVRLPLVGSWHAYWPLFSSFFFTPMRCTMCPDQGAELADLSFGDAWLPELLRERNGTSIVVSRTSIGQSLLDKAQSANAIHLSPVNIEKITQSQFVNLRFKKDDLSSRLSMLHKFGWETPSFKPKPAPSTSLISVLRALYIYSNIKASSSKHFRSLLRNVPFPLIRLYYGVYKSLCTI